MKRFLLCLVPIFLFSCNLFQEEDPIPLNLADKLERSLYSIPQSLQGGTAQSQSQSAFYRNLGTDYEPITHSIDPGDVYGLISLYLDFADNIRELLETMIGAILIQNLNLFQENTLFVLPDDDGGTLGFALVSDTDFSHKIYLYQDPVLDASSQIVAAGENIALDQCSTQANLIIQFNENGNGLTGESWFLFTDTDAQNLDTEISIHTIFSNNGIDGNLAIEIYLNPQYVEADFSSFSQSIQDDYHFKPTRVFLDMDKNGNTIMLSGCSYHPDWDLVSQWILPEPDLRNIYIFTAIAETGTGAKVNLALPLNTLNDTAVDWDSSMWQQDNLGARWEEMVRLEINQILTDLSDADPGTGTEYDGTWDDANFQRYMAATMVCLIRGSNIESPSVFLSNQTNFSQAQYDDSKTFWDSTNYTDAQQWFSGMDAYAISLSTSTAAVLNSNIYRDSLTEEQWDWVYLLVRSDDLLDEAAAYSYTIPQQNASDIVNYAVNADPEDPWASGLYPVVEPVLYMINPAFFTDADGFIGTWNTDTEIDLFYGLDNLVISPPSAFNSLKELDLDQITPYVPEDVIQSSFSLPVTITP